MRSDREELPEGWTKEQADKAEMKEARLQKEARTGLQARVAPGCQLYWPSEFEVCGAIRDKYNSLGAQFSFLLLPTTPELINPDGFGRRSHFQNGPIYWSAATGAHPVVNVFHQKWGEKGWEGGFLGYPKTDEVVLNGGRLQDFTGATIYWSPLTGAHPVGGAIRDKWAQTGWEGGTLGYPTTDENVLPGGQGRMNGFQRGVIYWSPNTGAWVVQGRILDIWAEAGYETSIYGYPTGDQTAGSLPGSAKQAFQNKYTISDYGLKKFADDPQGNGEYVYANGLKEKEYTDSVADNGILWTNVIYPGDLPAADPSLPDRTDHPMDWKYNIAASVQSVIGNAAVDCRANRYFRATGQKDNTPPGYNYDDRNKPANYSFHSRTTGHQLGTSYILQMRCTWTRDVSPQVRERGETGFELRYKIYDFNQQP
jgi:hypothetical protein